MMEAGTWDRGVRVREASGGRHGHGMGRRLVGLLVADTVNHAVISRLCIYDVCVYMYVYDDAGMPRGQGG